MKKTTTPKLLKAIIAFVLLAIFILPGNQASAQCNQNWTGQSNTTQNPVIPCNNTTVQITPGPGSYTYLTLNNGWPYTISSTGSPFTPYLTIMGSPAWTNVACGPTGFNWTHITNSNAANTSLLMVNSNSAGGGWNGTLKTVPSGCCSSPGTSAILQIRTNWVVANAISGAETVCYNAAQSPITASGFTGAAGAWTFDWYYRDDACCPSTCGYTFYTSGTGLTSITPPATTTTRAWQCYMYPVGNSGCFQGWASACCVKTIYSTAVPGTSSGTSTICSGGSPGTFTATASGSNGTYTYDWYYLDGGACPSTGGYIYTGYSQTTGGTSTYTPGSVTAAGGLIRKYQAYVNACGGLGTGWTSGCGTLNVQSTTNNPGTITAPSVVCPGAAFTVSNATAATTGSPASTGPTYNFYLEKQDAPNIAGFATVSSGLQAASSYNYTMPNAPGTYRVARSSAWGCVGEVSAPFLTITVPNTFNAGTTQADQTVCQVSGPAGLTSLSAALGGNGVYTYTWQSSTDNSIFADISPAVNTATYSPPSTVGTRYYRRKVSETGGCFTSPITTGASQNIAFSQTGVTGVTVNGTTITKNTGVNNWDAGLYGLLPIKAGGYIQGSLGQTNTNKMMALNSDPATDVAYLGLDYAIYSTAAGEIYIYQGGAGTGPLFTSSLTSDVYRIQWNSTTNKIEYLKNGAVFYTSLITPSATLYPDFSFFTPAGSFTNLVTQGDDNSKIVVQPTPGIPTVNGTTSNFAVSFCGSGTLSCVQGWEDQLLGSGPLASTCALYKGGVFQSFGTSFPITTAGTYTIYSYNNNTGTGVPCQGNVGVTVTVTLTTSFTVALTKSNYNGYNVSCSNSANGTITATPSANVYNMTYQWSTGTTNTVVSPTTNNTISGLSPGTYFVTVGDASGCESSASAVISAPPAVTVSLTPLSYGTGYGTNCAGASTGGVTSFPGGGTAAGWGYTWTSTPSGFVNPGTQAIGSVIARTYNVTVTESNGCTASASVALTDPSVITFTTGTGYACSGSTYTDGIVTIVASGGASGTYNYRRDGGAWQSSPIFSGNTNGSTHSFQVQDASYTSCLSATSNVTVTYPPNGVAVADCNFIYVSTTGDPTGTLGSKVCPVTLTQAFTIYAGAPARSQILMASGTYSFGSTISIPANITIDGGYDPNTWVKSTATTTILNISPSIVDNATYGTGYYIGMQPAGSSWKLQDLTINVQPGGAAGTYQSKGRSIFGVYINGQTGWTMTRCVVTTGSASAGLAGSGNTGSYSTGGAGAAGGGSGGGCSSCGANGGNGSAGSAGAAGGTGGGRCCSSGCNFFGCASNGCTAGNATGGATGGDGAAGGAGVQASGLNVFYVPQNGTNGGTAGSGGGGGGAYGTCCSCTCGPYNASGGAGGQGGYGGAGGLLGYGGGSSIAIYAYGGSGTLTDVNLAPGAAGAGGAGASGTGGGGTGVYYYGSDNSGWCDGGKGGTGGPGGFGGNGGTGGAGATGYSSTIQALNGASISWTGATVPNDGTVTANWYSGCTNSEIVITKTSGSAWTGIATDPAFELNSTSGATTYGTGSSTAVIYYPVSTTVGDKNLSLGSTTLNKFIKIKGNRLITPASSIISALANPCPLGAISVSHTLSAGQITNTTAYDWKISNVASPTVYIYNSNSPNPAATPATVNPPSGGWVLGATYQIRLQLTEVCCGPSIPMYSTFTIPSQLAQVSTITQSPSGTVCSQQTGVTYTASAVAGATGYTWTVTGGGVIQSGQGTATITVNWGAAVNGATVSAVPTNACTPSTDGPIKTNTFNVNGSPIATITPQGPTTFCSGGSVSLLAGASGGGGLGNGAMTYSWAPVSGAGLSSLSGTPVTATPPSGGVYTYTVVATEGGSGCTASASEIITMQTVPTAGSISTAQTICYGGDPAAFTSVAGTGYTGTSLSYRWERSVSPFSSWTTVSGNPTTATYDEPNGLLVTTQFRRTTIADLTGVLCESAPTTPVQITVNANLVAGTVGADQTICYNTAPATLTNLTSPTGGTGNYTYQWQSSTAFAGTFAGIGGALSSTYSPPVITATRYYQRLETSGACGTVTSNVVTITVNPNLVAGTVAASQTICYNTVPAAFTSSTLPTGGNGTYTYDWESATAVGGPFTSIGGAASTTYGPGALIATTYYRRAETSGAGCGTVYSNVVSVTVRPDLVAGMIYADQTICYNTVPATLNNSELPYGGTGVFSYLWESSPDNGITPFASISGSIFTSYAPGALTSTTYFRRTETSTLGCGSVISNVLMITVNPQLIAGSVAASQTICYGATPAALTSTGLPTGGVGTFTYQWKSSLNNSTYAAIGGATNTTYIPGALTATTYYRRDETSGTCGTVPSNVITITVPAQVVFTTSLTNVLCNAAGNGTITVNGSGGVSPYTFSKNDGVSYVSGADPYTFTGLAPGTYDIGILDANNCPSSFTAVDITEPAALSFTESHNPVTCSGGNTGSITVTAAGGTTGYLYSKNNGASYQVSNVFTTLPVGSYDVVVKDANNCVTAATTVGITGPTPISFTPSVVHVLCNGDNTGSITLSASGGTPGYTYSKDNGSNYQVSNVFSSLPQGIYAMKVKDANLCTATTQIVQVTEPTLVTYSTSSTNVVCNGANDGTITIDGNGGVAPYTYSITNGVGAFQVGANPFTFNSLTPGTYFAGLRDDNGCTKGYTTISISEPNAVTFTTSKVDVLCFGGNNASITVTASGGTGTLTYSKNNGASYQVSNVFSSLIAGAYQIKVKDASDCETLTQSVIITQPAVGLTVTTSNGSPYSTTVVASLFSNPVGGTPAYTYFWSGPYAYSSTLQNPTRSPTVVTMAGTYKVTVTDANGCTATSQTVMSVYDGYVWKGTLSSDWANNANWQFQVPDYPDDCTQNAFIESGTPFSPNVNIPGLTVGNVSLINGATLNLGNSLTICRNLFGSALAPYSVVNGPGTLIMKSIPSVSEKIANLVKFNATLQIDNNAGVIINSGNTQIINILELKLGVLSTGVASNLTFVSNSATHSAIIDNFSAGMAGSITGSVTMQRKYNAPTSPFYKTQHYVSSPANSLPLVQFGANGIPGYIINTTCNERMSSPGSPYGDVAQYDEDHGVGCTLQGWKILNSGNATNGRGYSMSKNGAGLLSITGAPNQATSYSRAGLTNSNWSNSTLQGYLDVSGWHMIGNPWLANLRITTNGGAGFDNQVAVWQTTGPFAGAFTYYQVGFDNVDIAPFQGFFVRKSNPGGTATYTINGTDRVRTPSSMPFYSLSLDQQLDVYVEDANGFMDKAVVGFSVDATDTFDAVYDANKIAASGRVLLYSMNNNLPLARNILTSIKTTSTVDLAFDPGNTGSFKMHFDKINTFDPTSYVMLEDKKTNLWYDAKDTSGYLFTADTSDARSRFVLHFTPATEITQTDATCTSQGTINVTQPGTATWTYTVTNSSASVVSTGTLNQATPITLNANPGVYDITLIDNNNYTVVKQVQVTGGQQVQSSFTASDLVVEEGVEITLNSTSTNATGNFWNFGDTDTASGLTVSHTYAAPGTYTVTLTSDNADCNAVSTQQITVTAKVVSNLNSITDKTGINIWSYGNTVFVDFRKQMKEQATIEIYNVLGQQLSNEPSGHSNVYHKTFSNLEASYAIVRVKNNDVITTRKVFIAGK